MKELSLKWKGDDVCRVAKCGSFTLTVEESLVEGIDFGWWVTHDNKDIKWKGSFKKIESAQMAAETWAHAEALRMLESLGLQLKLKGVKP